MGHTKEPWHYRVGKDGHEVWASLDEKSRMHVATCGWGESFAQANTRRLELIYLLANIWDSEFMNDPEWEDIDEPRINALVARAKGSAP